MNIVVQKDGRYALSNLFLFHAGILFDTVSVADTMTTDSMDTSSDNQFGGCEGPDAMYVKLISSDGHEFIVKRDNALTSGTIKVVN